MINIARRKAEIFVNHPREDSHKDCGKKEVGYGTGNM